jgi:hypothetical protein
MSFQLAFPYKISKLIEILPVQKSIFLRCLFLLSIFTLFISACDTASELLGSQASPTPPYPTPRPTQALPEAMVEFRVEIPPGSPSGEPIYLTILDEVTGLSLNSQRFEMQAEDDLHYVIKLSLPVGSTVKYRYARQSTYLAQEHTSSKIPVRYRLLQVQGPMRINDVISVWSDMAFNGSTGRIQGHAMDANTGAPLPGLLVTAGGSQSFTAADGSFLIEGLPPGTHNLVAYAMDGSYQPFQQGAIVAADSTTPTPIQLTPSTFVNIVFTVVVPQNTMPAVPIRIAGNLTQLGNTFADLSGGVSVLASQMPSLSPLPDGRYSLTLSLPVGADVRYKYTLGDGFWNAEHNPEGEFRLRRLIVPDKPEVVEDYVASWGNSSRGPVLFDLTVPAETPTTDLVSIQFNPYGWTEPVPMWFLGEDHWAYILYSPLEIFDRLGYRYCRSDQCGSADDALTPGNDSFGRLLEPTDGTQTIQEKVDDWAYFYPDLPPVNITSAEIRPRQGYFMAGVEFQTNYEPSWIARMPVGLKEIQSMGANWLILPTTWTYTRQNPPVIEPISGNDPLWFDIEYMIERAHAFNLNVAVFPTPHFPQESEQWWAGAPLDFPWWQAWFDRYQDFILHHAELAQRQGAQALVLGGKWLNPALPGGVLGNGSPSGVPADVEVRWRSLIEKIRERYSGSLVWALPFPDGVDKPPPFLDSVDQIYVLWDMTPLARSKDAPEAEIHTSAAQYMDDLKSFQVELGKPLVMGITYPSADGGLTGCIMDPMQSNPEGCLNLDLLAPPNPDIPPISLDLQEQEQVYNAILVALNERDWIQGIVSRGYYPPVALQDKSTSVHGKPAGDILWYWYPRLSGKISP